MIITIKKKGLIKKIYRNEFFWVKKQIKFSTDLKVEKEKFSFLKFLKNKENSDSSKILSTLQVRTRKDNINAPQY